MLATRQGKIFQVFEIIMRHRQIQDVASVEVLHAPDECCSVASSGNLPSLEISSGLDSEDADSGIGGSPGDHPYGPDNESDPAHLESDPDESDEGDLEAMSLMNLMKVMKLKNRNEARDCPEAFFMLSLIFSM